MRSWLMLVVAGCGFHTHAVADGSVVSADGAPDTPVDEMPDAFDPLCFGHTPFVFCLPALPTTPLAFPVDKNFVTDPLSATTCDGGDGQILTIGGVQACVVAATTITTANPTGSYGALPLVLVATDSITITGLFDGRSAIGGLPGPDANPAACGNLGATAGADNATLGGGGGAGGSFGTPGDDGGTGGAAAVTAGAPVATQPGTTLRGGCPGGAGGNGGGGTRATGGNGGGAVYLVARNSISIAGTLTACGAGGLGGTSRGGGGGGGSGGMLILDAPMLMIDTSSAIIANGGGGGGGGGTTASGGNGGDATAIASAATGGAADATAGAGGPGAFGQTAATAGSPGANGGGGGGGGVGVIRVFSTQPIAPANVSPPPS